MDFNEMIIALSKNGYITSYYLDKEFFGNFCVIAKKRKVKYVITNDRYECVIIKIKFMHKQTISKKIYDCSTIESMYFDIVNILETEQIY